MCLPALDGVVWQFKVGVAASLNQLTSALLVRKSADLTGAQYENINAYLDVSRYALPWNKTRRNIEYLKVCWAEKKRWNIFADSGANLEAIEPPKKHFYFFLAVTKKPDANCKEERDKELS